MAKKNKTTSQFEIDNNSVTTKNTLEETISSIIDNTTPVKFKKLRMDAVIPTYAHDGDVGMDMTAIAVEYDRDLDTYVYHTGIACESEYKIAGMGFPRSSNKRTNCYLTNSVGVIDSAIYRGDICWCYKNRTSIHERIVMEALHQYSMAPWWQKITQNQRLNLFAKYQESATTYYLDNALDYAPYRVGERVGQLVFLRCPLVNGTEVNELNEETERGTDGFGSTGK